MASGKPFHLSLTKPTGKDRSYHLKFAGNGIKKVCADLFYLSSYRSDLHSCIRTSRTRAARTMSPDHSTEFTIFVKKKKSTVSVTVACSYSPVHELLAATHIERTLGA